jgi:hypothetical protein
LEAHQYSTPSSGSSARHHADGTSNEVSYLGSIDRLQQRHPGTSGTATPDLASEACRFVSDEISIQPRYSGEASSETFGDRLHQYIVHSERRPPPRPYVYYKNPKLLRISSTECNLPNKNYAKLLVRAVLRFIGGDHHLLLKKSFLGKLEETYQQEILDDRVWLCRLFAVLALGELYSGGRAGAPKGTGVPGTGFFVKAMGFFQDMHEEPTVPYIETLLLLVSPENNNIDTCSHIAVFLLRSTQQAQYRIHLHWYCHAT